MKKLTNLSKFGKKTAFRITGITLLLLCLSLIPAVSAGGISDNYWDNLENTVLDDNGEYYNPTVQLNNLNTTDWFRVYEYFGNWIKQDATTGENYLSVEEITKSSIYPFSSIFGLTLLYIICLVLLLLGVFNNGTIGYTSIAILIICQCVATFLSGFDATILGIGILFACLGLGTVFFKLAKGN